MSKRPEPKPKEGYFDYNEFFEYYKPGSVRRLPPKGTGSINPTFDRTVQGLREKLKR